MGRRLSLSVNFLVLLAGLVASAFLFAEGARAEAPLQRLEFVTQTGAHEFRVELADTPGERAKGLMYRKHLPEDQGMLFVFYEDGPIMMWMKNTHIPLDMIFVSRHGMVTSIAANAAPMSEATISSDGPAYAVIELNAGAAARIGLKPGDEVRHPAFKR
ncbi:DUF192 domain-containing protein [Methylocystis parvus]|nr:DUF192 domain-containing protein [Methylocystis parvus]WBK00848.1 DUF192 domain-containing protein [Methylocystis parvus OBBP]